MMKKYCIYALMACSIFTLSGCGDDEIDPTPSENTGNKDDNGSGNQNENNGDDNGDDNGGTDQKDDGSEVYSSDVSIRHWEWGGEPIEECMKKVGTNLYEYHITGKRAENWPLRDVTRMYFITPKGLMGVYDVVSDWEGSFYYGNLNPADWFTDSAAKDWKTSEYFTYYDFPERTNNGTSPYGNASAWYRTTGPSHLVWTSEFQLSITHDIHNGGDAVITVDLNNYTFTYTDGKKAMPAQDHWYVYSHGGWSGEDNYQHMSDYNDMKQNGFNSGIMSPLTDWQDDAYGDYAPQLSCYWWYKGQKYMLEDHSVSNIKYGYNEYGEEYVYITSPLVPGSHEATLVEVQQSAWYEYRQYQNETTLMWPKDKCWRISSAVYKKNGKWWAIIYTSDTCFKEDIEKICR